MKSHYVKDHFYFRWFIICLHVKNLKGIYILIFCIFIISLYLTACPNLGSYVKSESLQYKKSVNKTGPCPGPSLHSSNDCFDMCGLCTSFPSTDNFSLVSFASLLKNFEMFTIAEHQLEFPNVCGILTCFYYHNSFSLWVFQGRQVYDL